VEIKLPTETHLNRMFTSGCGILPHEKASWKQVEKVELVSLNLTEKAMLVDVVFLDKENTRVLPYGKALAFDVEFKKRVKKFLPISKENQKQGIFTFELPQNSRAKPCNSFLGIEFNGADGKIKYDLDDWLYSC
jgi:hypothetical protein